MKTSTILILVITLALACCCCCCLMIGFAWGVGGLGVTGVGWWADRIGVPTALSVAVMTTAVVACAVTLFLREGVTRPIPLSAKVEPR